MSLKLSQQIELEASQQESDWKAWRLHEKAYKQEMKEYFQDEILPKIKASQLVSFVTEKANFFQIGFKDGNIYDYYPGRDRIMRHKPSTWFYGGKKLLAGMISQPEKTIEQIEWEPELSIHDPELPGVVIIDKTQ